MAATAQPGDATSPRLVPPLRARAVGVERLALAAAGATCALHVGWESVTGADGVPAWSRLARLTLTVLPIAVLWWRYARLRPGLRAFWCLAVGVAPAADAALHVASAMSGVGPAPDVTGLAIVASGASLPALAVVVPFVHRAEARRRGRWRRRGLTALALLTFIPLVALPWGGAVVQTHAMPEAPPPRPDPAYRDVVLLTEDGVELSGWYRPSSSGAAVVLVPSAGGTRTTVLSQARMLSRHGYGVLVYDSRGSGASSGMRNAYGWTWTADVRAAVRYMADQPTSPPDE